HPPTLTAIRALMNILAAVVDAVVIVRREEQRAAPIPAILHIRGRPAIGAIRPRRDLARLPGLKINAREQAIEAAAVDNVIVNGMGNREAALTPTDTGPIADPNTATETATSASAPTERSGCWRRRCCCSPRSRGHRCRSESGLGATTAAPSTATQT